MGDATDYDVLKHHPGSEEPHDGTDYDTIPASRMVHYFLREREGQKRGIPELFAALPLFAQLRRYTLSVIRSADTAASISGVLHTDAPANGDPDEIEPMDVFDIEQDMFMTLPATWKATQIKAEQPVQTYGEFKREILNEIGRCVNMPYNIVACNSSEYNYASGRMDHQTYFKSIRCDQTEFAEDVLDMIFDAWLLEASFIPGFLPERIRYMARFAPWMVSRKWYWDGTEHVDPEKEANSQEKRLH